jgi:membrane protein
LTPDPTPPRPEPPPPGIPVLYPMPGSRLSAWWKPTIQYLLETEVHAYALAIAACVLLSFFPFLVVIESLCRYVLHWPAAVRAIDFALGDVFPDELAFLRRNLTAIVELRGPGQFVSLFLLMITAQGIFMPLEVALNRAWGVRKNRSYLRVQAVSFGLVFLCGSLVLASFLLTALAGGAGGFAGNMTSRVLALPVSILALFFIYWLLPNRRIAPASVIPAALFVGMLLEGLKYLHLLAWPLVRARLRLEYGPFYISVSIILLNFLASLVVLAGAELASRKSRSVMLE